MGRKHAPDSLFFSIAKSAIPSFKNKIRATCPTIRLLSFPYYCVGTVC
jgi:hypothetical protein